MLNFTIRIGSTPTFSYFNLHLYSAYIYAVHYCTFNYNLCLATVRRGSRGGTFWICDNMHALDVPSTVFCSDNQNSNLTSVILLKPHSNYPKCWKLHFRLNHFHAFSASTLNMALAFLQMVQHIFSKRYI